MCQQCDQFDDVPHIKLPADLKQVVNRITAAVTNKLLEITSGDLQWSDYIECDVRCTNCGANFRLCCETYHGAGGSLSRI